MAEHLASIFGTEKDRVNCPFYFNIGACRHGDRCSRLHTKPSISPTLLLSNMYQRPDMMTPGLDPQGQAMDPNKIQQHFEDFYEDLFEELGKYGEIESLNICDNLADHMVGNVYAQFREEEHAANAVRNLTGRFYAGAKNAEVTESLVEKLHSTFSNGLPIATPISTLRTNEFELVQALLRMLQGFSSYFFYWDDKEQTFCRKTGVYLSHLSQTSLNGILSQFISSATCLQFVEVFVKKVESSLRSPPTLKAFAHSVSVWLKRLRHAALEEENKMMDRSTEMTPTLLGLSNALSSLCSGAEYLQKVVDGVAAGVNIEHGSSIPANEMAVHILDHLYKKLNEVCLVQGGEEEAYLMLLFIFLGSSLPYVEALDSWLYDGILDDPYEELFFFANNAITISQAEFWEKSYLLRPQCRKLSPGTPTINGGVSVESMASGKVMSNREAISISVRGKDRNNIDLVACPSFLKDIAMAIVSTGKSLQLIQHTTKEYLAPQRSCDNHETDGFGRSKVVSGSDEMRHEKNIGRLTLSEIFCVSLVGLIGDGDHLNKRLRQGDQSKSRMEKMFELYLDRTKLKQEDFDTTTTSLCSDRNWFKILANTEIQKGNIGTESSGLYCFNTVNEGDKNLSSLDHPPFAQSFCVENPVITVCQTLLNKNRASHDKLVVSRNFHLPPLNDEGLYEAVFREMDRTFSVPKETNYMFGFQYGESDYIRSKEEMKTLELLYPFPTLLPSFQEDLHITELFPVQENSTLTARILNWIQGVVPKDTPLPVVILQECLVVYIKEQVNYVGQHILLKLMHGWRLMDELGVLRAIYLLGSGDLLQHFLTVLFDKLDKGESWDDDFELNTVLQESIRNSADSSMLLSVPDSLVVSITKHDAEGNEQYCTQSTNLKGRSPQFGIDTLDMLKFMYKVSWPLELIANSEAIKKYNQVMNFLLKVKRAKFVLDKARRWMWKGRGAITSNQKHHWLVEQKLLHFVDALHQYVMDRVFHNSWLELCEGIALAGSLDEVIEVHDAYLLSIQRQCFVAPDKLWALIASRIKSILGLALDFYAVQQTLSSSGAALAIKARCEMEINRIEKQFDDCIAFLLRVLSFKLNVGHFPHLADLVTRINYNYFYMSDSGNLVTVPGSDATASKLVKASTVRSN